MPVTLTVNNIPIEYPVPGDSPGWGQSATEWATQVTLALQDLQGLTDIPQKTFTIQNDVQTFTDIAGLTFNTGLVRAAFIDYSIYRTSTSNPSGQVECGNINIVYDNLAAPGSKWRVVGGLIAGSSGITFQITDAGQFQYKSTDLGAGHSANMHFRAKTLNQ
jgi:hypothetical protein